MWQKPYRPSKEISQTFNDGIVTVYAVTDAARPGYKPTPGLIKRIELCYEERVLGIQRFFSGKQNQIKVERVIRCPATGQVSTQDVAITEDGQQYRIDLIQKADGVYPPSVDMTLTHIEQKYEVSV